MILSPTWLEILIHPFRFYILSTVHVLFLVAIGLATGMAYICGLDRKLKLSGQVDWWVYIVLGLVGSFGADVVLSFGVYYFFWPMSMYANKWILMAEVTLGAFFFPFLLFKPFS